MNHQEEAWETLDAEFDHHLVDMKPYVLKLPQRLERQRCALWIRKLCDPSGAGIGVTGRKNRNLYAKLLLHMLKRGVLEGPFTHKPEEGTLKTLPTYMSIYFDEPLPPRFQSSGSGGLPDWVQGELEVGADHSTSPHRPHPLYSRSLARSLSPARRPPEDPLDPLLMGGGGTRLVSVSRDDSDLDTVLHSWNLGIENPRYLRDKASPLTAISPGSRVGADLRDERAVTRLHQKEMDLKVKALEAKYQEEKLRLQQRHDADVQKILERKNNEMEEMKNLYRSKQSEAEESVRRLEKKVQTLLRESQLIRETKDAQIEELKKLCQESAESLRNQCQQKLHSAVVDMEQEKFELQKTHTEKIQELLDDTNTRLLKMEADYLTQTKATAQTVKELETRVQHLTVEAESSSQQRQKLCQEKAEVEALYQATRGEIQQLSARVSALQKERDHQNQDHDSQLQQLRHKYEGDISFITQQNALSAAKATALIEELEKCLSRSKQQGQEREHQLQQDMREQQAAHQKEKLQMENHWERKVLDLHKKLEEEKENNSRKIAKMAEELKEREEMLRLQAEATEEFKRQVERNTEKVYSEMKEQMEKVEADLNRSKSLREKQSQESGRHLQEVTERWQQQMVELKWEQEQEKSRLQKEHSAERDRLIQEHSAERDRLIQEHERNTRQLQSEHERNTRQLQSEHERNTRQLQSEHERNTRQLQSEHERNTRQLQSVLSEHQSRTQARSERDAQTIADLESQVYKMKEDLVQVNAQHKQQLLELGLLRDEEKQRTAAEHHKALSKVRGEMEKAGVRLLQMEKEYSEKLAKTSQVISDLQASVTSLQEESTRQQLSAERRLQEEKRQQSREHQNAVQLLKDEVSGYCAALRLAERRLQDKELELQEQVTHIRQEYELKIRGLMPAALRQELEDTITSLKSQVNFLQKRVQVLQDDLSIHQGKRL